MVSWGVESAVHVALLFLCVFTWWHSRDEGRSCQEVSPSTGLDFSGDQGVFQTFMLG